METLKEVTKHKFTLLLLEEMQYETRLDDIVKMASLGSRVCYVCLSRPYSDILEYVKNLRLDPKKFVFVDVLTSHYKKQKKSANCIFVDDPANLAKLQTAVQHAVTKRKCRTIILDTVSSLLMYEQSHDILRFTNQLKNEDADKIFIIVKGSSQFEYSQSLVDDISMFADKTIDLEK